MESEQEHCCVCNIDAPLANPEDAFRVVYCAEHEPKVKEEQPKPLPRGAEVCVICGNNAHYKFPWRPVRERGKYCFKCRPDSLMIRLPKIISCKCSLFGGLKTHGVPCNRWGVPRKTAEMCVFCAIEKNKSGQKVVDIRVLLTSLFNKKYGTNFQVMD